MRITSKGQVTIPQAIREQCGLLPHTEVRFEREEGRVLLVKQDPPASAPMSSWPFAGVRSSKAVCGFERDP
jgi:AbrB family looped-hinge helix DNA binding protein